MRFILKYGRTIDTVGAALFLVMMVVTIIFGPNTLFPLAFMSGFFGFVTSLAIWNTHPSHELHGTRTLCAFFAIASVILFVLAIARWVMS